MSYMTDTEGKDIPNWGGDKLFNLSIFGDDGQPPEAPHLLLNIPSWFMGDDNLEYNSGGVIIVDLQDLLDEYIAEDAVNLSLAAARMFQSASEEILSKINKQYTKPNSMQTVFTDSSRISKALETMGIHSPEQARDAFNNKQPKWRQEWDNVIWLDAWRPVTHADIEKICMWADILYLSPPRQKELDKIERAKCILEQKGYQVLETVLERKHD